MSCREILKRINEYPFDPCKEYKQKKESHHKGDYGQYGDGWAFYKDSNIKFILRKIKRILRRILIRFKSTNCLK